MSATRRKGKQTTFIPEVNERNEDDFYRTPADAVNAVLRDPLSPSSQMPPLREPRTWIDAGAGDGAIAAAVLHRWPESRGICIEIDRTRARTCSELLGSRVHVVQTDFLDLIWPDPSVKSAIGWTGKVDLVIANPPFKDALLFAYRALELAQEVALLLRVGFEEGAVDSDRSAFLEQHPHDLGILTWRPDFNGQGTDSATYAWLVFGHGRGGRWARLPRRPVVVSSDAQLSLIGMPPRRC